MLNIAFAPRIKDIGTQELYSFVNRKQYIDLGYQVLPDHYINNQLIENNWDDMLRVMVSLKLGKTSAFQLLKRLNSYAKQNPLQKAMKEFGKITRTSFILRYYNDLELRQSIEKLLSHIELMNRFSKAVFFGNNQEFQVATKDEQEKIILCRRLIQNSIVLWNYLYLSNLLTDYQSQDELEELIAVIRNGTAVTWQHINMIGEYDFNTIQFDQSLRFDMQKLKAWKYLKSA
jgi:TnpA family transposase